MRDLLILLIHLITTVVRLATPGGVRSIVAESVLVMGRVAAVPQVGGLHHRYELRAA